MRRTRWLATLAAALAMVTEVQAQVISVGRCKDPGDPGPSGSRHHCTVYLSSSPYLGAYAGMPYCAYPVARVTFLQPFPPGLGLSVLGMPVTRAGYFFDPDLENLVASRPPRTEPLPLPAPLDPGAPASVFRIIQPEDRLRALMPEQPEMPPPPAVKQPRAVPPPVPKPRAAKPEPKPLPGPPAADTKPRDEHLHQIRLGREAFAAREYGRAERRFYDATLVLPEEPLGYFLLAQAQFALGKYQEAVTSIEAGMRLNTNWPGALFWPRDLYESNGGDYVEHLKVLAQAQARFPEDPVLLFLMGYELWFDDKREEARPFFIRAAARSPNPSFSRRFVPPIPQLPFAIW